jgi:hypothetical protein
MAKSKRTTPKPFLCILLGEQAPQVKLQVGMSYTVRHVFFDGLLYGIQVRNPGAPKKWTMDVCKEMIAAVQAVAAETGMTVARSIEILKKRDPGRWQSLSEPRYYEAVRQLKKSI